MASILVHASTAPEKGVASIFDLSWKHKHHHEKEEETAEEDDPELRRKDSVFKGRQVQSDSLPVDTYGVRVDRRCVMQRWAKTAGGSSQEEPARRKALL